MTAATDSDSNHQLRIFKLKLSFLAVARGAVFWYAIEKLFELQIGLTLENVVAIGALAQGSKLVFELPSSVLADRWSRRNSLILANALLLLCALILGMSNDLIVYVVGVLVWSMADALASGVYEAFIYDSLAAMNAKEQFKRVYSRVRSIEMFVMALAGLIAGRKYGYRVSFFASAATSLISIRLLLSMAEPRIVKSSDMDLSWLQHTGETIRLMRSSTLRWLAFMNVMLIAMVSVWYEYYQLVGLALSVPKWLFGTLIGLLTIGKAVGYEISHRLSLTKTLLISTWLALILAHAIGLRVRLVPFALVNIFLIFVFFTVVDVYIQAALQRELPSQQRASVMSLISTLGYTWFLVVAAGFGWLLKHYGVITAMSTVFVPVAFVAVIDARRVFGVKNWRDLHG